MTPEEILQVEKDIVATLKNIYDPEIPVNIYDLGLIYEIDYEPDGVANIRMTLTAPNCPMADMLVEDVNQQVAKVKGVKSVNVILTFDPVWDKSMMSEEALLDSTCSDMGRGAGASDAEPAAGRGRDVRLRRVPRRAELPPAQRNMHGTALQPVGTQDAHGRRCGKRLPRTGTRPSTRCCSATSATSPIRTPIRSSPGVLLIRWCFGKDIRCLGSKPCCSAPRDCSTPFGRTITSVACAMTSPTSVHDTTSNR